MGINSTKLSSTDYSLIFSSPNSIYRGLSIIQGEIHLNIRKKFCIEKKLRLDLIGELIDKTKHLSMKDRHRTFFTYSYPLVISHQNGIARIIKHQQMKFPFRIPLGINLPPSCDFKEFSIVYSLEIYHDERRIANLRKTILLAPPIPHLTVPLPCKTTGINNINMICTLQKTFYSGRENTIIPLTMIFENLQDNQLQCIIIQLIQMVHLNDIFYENEITLNLLNDIVQDKELKIIYELNLTKHLPPTYLPNKNGQPDNLPSISIEYQIRTTAQMKNTTNGNLSTSVPIGIE